MSERDSSSSDRSRPPRAPLRQIALSLGVLILLWGLPELALRALWSPAPGDGPVVGEPRFIDWLEALSVQAAIEEGGARGATRLYRGDPSKLWALAPGVLIETRNYHAADLTRAPSIEIQVNDRGYRGKRDTPGGAQSDSPTQVVCMGDSNFFGYPLDDEQTFPAALGRALSSRARETRYQVLNAGVPGYSVVQGLRWYREEFESLEPEVVLLSYLNNDAWRQPSTDTSLLARSSDGFEWLRAFGNESYLVRYVASHRKPPDEADLVERVPLPEFRASYRSFLEEIASRGARAVIVDFRTEDAYAPYSAALRRLSEELEVDYVFVLDRIVEAQQRDAARTRYAPLLRRVRERWGKENLRAYPHLAYYAELQPEHLNEIGAEILADEIARRILAMR